MYLINSRPSVAAVYRMLPATLADILAGSGLSDEHTRTCVRVLLAAKLAYVSGWTTGLQPQIAKGCNVNVPRPSPESVRYAYGERSQAKHARYEYQRQYRLANKEKRAAYSAANREKLNAARNERMRLKRAIARGHLVATDAAPVTTWRNL
jgi:short-subunit dehydrogenase